MTTLSLWSHASICLVVTASFSSAATAQGPSNLPAMTLQQALSYARDHQPQIRSAVAEVQARVADAAVPRAQWLPQVGATAQLFVGTANNSTASYLGVSELDLPRIGGSRSTTAASAGFAPSASTIVGIGVDQEIFDFGRISAQAAVADAAAAMARAGAAAVDLDVELAVEEAYHSVLAGRQVLRATEDALVRAETHRDYARAGTKSGMRPPIELTRAEADVAQLRVGVVRAEAGLHIGRAALAAATGADAAEVDAAEADAADTAVDSSPGPALAAVLQIASQHNPAIAAAAAKLRAQHAAVAAVTRELLPNVFASASLTGRAGGATPSSGPGDVPYGAGWLPDVVNWHVGLVLQWNLFDGTILARRTAAKARERVAAADLDVARSSVTLATTRGALELDAALQALPALQSAVEAARANQTQAEARFKAGLGNIVELADAEGLLTSSQLQLAVGQFAAARARASLARVIGQAVAHR
ncbi:MAG: outer rane efflux protein [Myxococcales bacterium]|nr:outer rane efflux protein [Myxococcales bacterium]